MATINRGVFLGLAVEAGERGRPIGEGTIRYPVGCLVSVPHAFRCRWRN